MHIINIIFLPQNNRRRRTKWMDVKLFYKLPTVKQYIGTTKTVQEPSTSKTLFTKKNQQLVLLLWKKQAWSCWYEHVWKWQNFSWIILSAILSSKMLMEVWSIYKIVHLPFTFNHTKLEFWWLSSPLFFKKWPFSKKKVLWPIQIFK